MIATTATVALIGMVVVFAFLGILVVCIAAMGMVARKTQPAGSATAGADDPRLIAAIAAAYHRTHQSPPVQ